MDFSEIKGHENIKRAIEIAILGEHFMALKIARGYGVSILCEAAYYISRKAMDTSFFIALFDETKQVPYYNDFDIVVEMTPLNPELLFNNRKSESTEDIIHRIKETLNYPEPLLILDNDSVVFLKSAMSRLTLTFKQANKIIRVSRTIARLDKESTIKCHHIAEAINYQNFRND